MSRSTYPCYWAYLSTKANHVKRCFSQPLYSRRAGWGEGLRGTLGKPAESQRKIGLKISTRLALFIQLPNQLLKFHPNDWHICKNYSISRVRGRPSLRKNRMWTAFEMKSQTSVSARKCNFLSVAPCLRRPWASPEQGLQATRDRVSPYLVI